MKSALITTLSAALVLSLSSAVIASDDNYDLDDIRGWKTVKMETCLDAVLDTIPGNARKLEMKLEDGRPVYEFDIEAKADGQTYNVECDAIRGVVTEIEREADANDPIFKKYAKISQEEARQVALDFNPGKVVAEEREVGM